MVPPASADRSATSVAARRVVTPGGVVGPATVHCDAGLIRSVEAAAEAPDLTLVPGFVDLQVNGSGAVDVGRASPEEWDQLGMTLLAQGVTTWCPTLTSRGLTECTTAIARVSHLAGSARGTPAPRVAGIHLEGPFLSTEYRGAHPAAGLRPIDLEWIRALPPDVAIVTLAPELPGALDAIAALTARGVVAALGHSGASADVARAAVAAGARLVTHVFNAMRPLHHRDPGLVGVALTDDALTTAVIADGAHVDDDVLRLVMRSKGPERVVLVTDSVAWAASTSVEVRDGAPRLADGTLAGSALTMDAAIRRVAGLGVSLEHALAAATWNPARVLGRDDIGRIEAGARGDLVALNPDLTVAKVWVGGVPAWAAA